MSESYEVPTAIGILHDMHSVFADEDIHHPYGQVPRGPLFHYMKGMSRIKNCWKRATSSGMPGKISMDHPLAITWSNIKMFIDASPEDHSGNLKDLDYMAMKIDYYARDGGKVDGDESLCAILHEWKQYASKIGDFSLL